MTEHLMLRYRDNIEVLIFLALVLAALSGFVLVPKEPVLTKRIASLQEVVPRAFAGWREDTGLQPVLPSPDLLRTIHKIYDDTLTRTYRDGSGNRVMLVIAFGQRQSDLLQAHQPEVCYFAQGFIVETRGTTLVRSAFGRVPGKRLYAVKGLRTEPVLYWLAVGGKITDFGWQQKLAQLRFGVRGKVPFGYVVRASLIGPDKPASYSILNRFLGSLLDAVPPRLRHRMAGL